MTCIAWGQLVDPIGHCTWTDDHADSGDGWLVAWRETRHATRPAANYAAVQPADIPVDLDHDGRRVGRLVYCERNASGLHGVAVLDQLDLADVADLVGRARWSTTTAGHTYPGDRNVYDMEIHSASLTLDPASVGLSPVKFAAGTLDHVLATRTNLAPALVARAVEHRRRQPWNAKSMQVVDTRPLEDAGGIWLNADGDPVGIVTPDHRRRGLAIHGSPVSASGAIGDSNVRPRAPIEHFRGGRILSVR